MKTLTDAEFDAVTGLDAPARYRHFLKEVADWEQVWSLCTDRGWVMAEELGIELVPMWPHERYAAVCATGAWHGAVPDSVELTTLVKEWLPHLAREQRGIAVFPVPSGKGVPVSADDLSRDLERAILAYE
jgi:hypothetical protein